MSYQRTSIALELGLNNTENWKWYFLLFGGLFFFLFIIPLYLISLILWLFLFLFFFSFLLHLRHYFIIVFFSPWVCLNLFFFVGFIISYLFLSYSCLPYRWKFHHVFFNPLFWNLLFPFHSSSFKSFHSVTVFFFLSYFLCSNLKFRMKEQNLKR